MTFEIIFTVVPSKMHSPEKLFFIQNGINYTKIIFN